MSFISSPPATPGGSTTQLQRNNAGAFAGSTSTDDGSTLKLIPGANSTSAVQITKADGTTVILKADTTNSQILATSGTQTNPGYAFSSSVGSGIFWTGSHLTITETGNVIAQGSGNDFVVASKLYLSSSADTALNRASAGVIEIDSGSTGVLRDLSLRKISSYGNATAIATAGWGVPAIYSAGRATAQVAANASVATYTVGAADGSFEVSANVLVTTATAHNFTVTCAYTDEGNTARTLTLNFSSLAGVFATPIVNTGGAVPYEGVPMHIRCKAATAITIATTGTFTTVTYNVEGIIKQMA